MAKKTLIQGKKEVKKIKQRLASQFIKNKQQREIFLNEATQFKQWANYIAIYVLAEVIGMEKIRARHIRNILKYVLLPDHFGKPGAKEGSLLTQDVVLGSIYHEGWPCLIRTSRGYYKFVGFSSKKSLARRKSKHCFGK